MVLDFKVNARLVVATTINFFMPLSNDIEDIQNEQGSAAGSALAPGAR